MVAGLALAGILAGSAFAQEEAAKKQEGKKGNRGAFGGGAFAQTLKWADFTFATAPANGDAPALTQAIYETAALSKLPATADKDAAKTTIDARFIAIATAAGVASPTASTVLSKNQYNEGVVNSMSNRGGFGGGAGGFGGNRGGGGGAGGGRGNRGGGGGAGGGAGG
jgi:hypothetical protein